MCKKHLAEQWRVNSNDDNTANGKTRQVMWLDTYDLWYDEKENKNIRFNLYSFWNGCVIISYADPA